MMPTETEGAGGADIRPILLALAGLKNESRLAIYRALVHAGPAGMTPGCLGKELGIPGSTLSFHLGELSHADLITCVARGRTLTYFANHPTMQSVLSFLTANCCARAGQNE